MRLAFSLPFLLLALCCTYTPKVIVWDDGSVCRLCPGQITVINGLEGRPGDALERAMAWWNSALGEELFVYWDGSGGVVWAWEERLDNPDWDASVRYSRDPGVDSCASGTVLRLSPDWSEKYTDTQLTTLMAHELGHTLGLDHSPYEDSLMWRSPHTRRAARHVVPGLLAEELALVMEMWVR